ncbi:CAP domain-containing protein [Prolixibacteraceae bacterium Z1-6]|uniref:CAP domain-containing protein n=1 Tax=Draconibacterium aestuarii TaxID=2998507 RepID=A0A9X3FAV5_9BACT|nr:CAP domain-containing protein [Prolixibacteraceae bacterium Z1-6]
MKIWITILLICAGNLFLAKAAEPDKRLNTAANANYLSTLEKEVVYEINLFRSNPAKYAEKYIAPLAQYYDRKILHYPGDVAIKTQEGVKALHECVRVLSKAHPLPIMYPNKGLTLAAIDHQKDQQKTGKTGHTGSDRSDMKERIERYCSWQTRIAENIAYGNSSARQVVIFLLIDDDVKNRGHRTNLLHPAFKTVGVTFGEHPIYQTMCVIDFAGDVD